jgi:hypothetical protein
VLVIATVPSEALWPECCRSARSNPHDTTERAVAFKLGVQQSTGNIAGMAQVVESTKWEKAWSRKNAAMHLKR